MSYDLPTMPVHCAMCDLLTWDPHTVNQSLVCAQCAKEMNDEECVCGRDGVDCPSCTAKLAGSIETVDEADKIVIYGYFSNMPSYHIDAIYGKNGATYVDVSVANRSAFEPPDRSTYRYDLVEVNAELAVRFTEITWMDGTKERHA